MQLTLEKCNCLHIGRLQKAIKKQIQKDYPESESAEIYNYTIKELDNFSVNDQKFAYSSMENELGGYRWFFLCPKCKNRASKLFLPPAGLGFENKYLCKNCHGIRNQSVVYGHNRLYKKVLLPLKRLSEIEKRLEKGYMSPNKVKELLDEYESLENEMKKNPEYRLWKFKKNLHAPNLSLN